MMPLPLTFNRMEFAGSLGDLGVVLPLAIGMILVNGLDPSGLFLSAGLFYILTGLYFGITTPGAVFTLVIGLWMLYDYAWAAFGSHLWLQLKLVLLGVLVAGALRTRRYTRSVSAFLAAEIEQLGPHAPVAVLPEGPMTVTKGWRRSRSTRSP